MKFEELYERAIIMWPDKIDISDGVQVSEESYLFKKLSKIWDSVEVEAKLLGEWYDLIT